MKMLSFVDSFIFIAEKIILHEVQPEKKLKLLLIHCLLGQNFMLSRVEHVKVKQLRGQA